MKPTLTAAFFLSQALLTVAEPRTPQPRAVPMAHHAPRAWLGLKVAKPDETITAHVPSLPQGIGFLVKSLDEGGPAQRAGIQELDLVWKFGDQMLVNEAQLATLLRLSKPGEEVVIAGFRGGKPLEVKLKLGEAPVLEKPFPGELVETAVLPGSSSGPMRVVNLAEKSASFSADEGRVVVRRDGEIYQVKISDPKDEVIFEGVLANAEDLEKVPQSWHRKVRVLCRTLDQSLEGRVMPQRQSRPRVVQPPSVSP